MDKFYHFETEVNSKPLTQWVKYSDAMKLEVEIAELEEEIELKDIALNTNFNKTLNEHKVDAIREFYTWVYKNGYIDPARKHAIRAFEASKLEGKDDE